MALVVIWVYWYSLDSFWILDYYLLLSLINLVHNSAIIWIFSSLHVVWRHINIWFPLRLLLFFNVLFFSLTLHNCFSIIDILSLRTTLSLHVDVSAAFYLIVIGGNVVVILEILVINIVWNWVLAIFYIDIAFYIVFSWLFNLPLFNIRVSLILDWIKMCLWLIAETTIQVSLTFIEFSNRLVDFFCFRFGDRLFILVEIITYYWSAKFLLRDWISLIVCLLAPLDS